MNVIKRWLHKHGLFDSTWLDARDGEYKNVFCPHCGAFIPNKYRYISDIWISVGGMYFECPDCDRVGVVLEETDYESRINYDKLFPYATPLESNDEDKPVKRYKG